MVIFWFRLVRVRMHLRHLADNRLKLIIWDAEGEPPVGNWTTVLWGGFGKPDDPNVISLPKLVEEKGEVFRARYLAWIYELGETRINGKRLVDRLELRPGFSYWWMTSLAQKFNASGTSQINNAIKALALENLISERKPVSIVLVSNNDKLSSTLQSFCKRTNLKFQRNSAKQTEKPKSIVRLIYDSSPCPVRAMISFSLYLLKSLPLICTKHPSPTLVGEITFVDVLVHLNRKTFTTGKFISNYWTTLVDKLLQSSVKINWLHNYFYQEALPSLVRAQELIGRFNKCYGNIHTHALIEKNLSLSVFVKALKDYFIISMASFNISKARHHFVPIGSEFDFWPLFKYEWIASLRGQEAMANFLRLALYEKTFRGKPHQRLGVYIQENQPWEMALIYAWKAAEHGKLIGMPHTTVRYWDLRYFYDPRSYESSGDNFLPIPDQVAVNGTIAKNAYFEGGYPESRIAEVEALRFLHLLNSCPKNAAVRSQSKALRVLVCGDFPLTINYKILSWLSIAAKSLPSDTSYVFKPHPAYPVELSDYQSLFIEMTNVPLPELFADCDVVFTTNSTSAAVDAYCTGKPVIQMLDGNACNMSPLRGLKGVVYVTNPMELAEALLNARHHKCEVSEPYFYLDKELPRWSQLLGLSPVTYEKT